MTKAFGYMRASSRGQAADDKDSYPRQKESILKYAAAHDLEIVQWFEDAFTGKAESRPALEKMIAALDSNGVKVVIFDRLERLARKLTAQEAIIARLQASKVVIDGKAECKYKLISVLEPDLIPEDDDDMESAMRVAMRQMMGIFAELDRKSIVYKLRGARQRAKAKDPSKIEGRKPYGSKPGEEEVVKRIFQLHGEGNPVREIIDALNKDGIQPRGTKKGKGVWHPMVIARILKRPNIA